MILTQSQSMLFITACTLIKNSQNISESIKMLIKKSIKKQSKHLISILIKTFLIFYTTEFYNLMSQLQLKVKRVVDWVKCNIIYLKISQNSKAYEMKNTWFQNEKHITLKSHSVHHVSNKAHDFILTFICMKHFSNLKFY